jgi:hypothetical protein
MPRTCNPAVPRFEERLTACQIRIGLAAQVYNDFEKRWDGLEETARRPLEVANADRRLS